MLSEKTVTLTLTLTAQEAAILMGLIQNPLCHPDKEPMDVQTFRHSLFLTLQDVVQPELLHK